ncbi:YycC family protein [Brevibacillus sp. SYP-B805]|uniref:YycC family protein n=1 Tax=Brevibacillus sp. SYP-B805 TaxID=1578199 RepID=UPI0013ECC1A6|nr:YycC family protein [Brevibacillus sp. SYP-B805]NGQ96265.1 YycC family protein [Brevibacillus sp. SYP-B805]
MRPLQISAETALKLSKMLNVPLEQLMHMPQHILMKKLMELAQQEQAVKGGTEDGNQSGP